jgi:hypothetical protein
MGYEYQDLNLPLPTDFGPGGVRFSFGGTIAIEDSYGYGATIEMAKLMYWQKMHSWVIDALKTWFDDGWEPVGQPGPEGVELRIHERDQSAPSTSLDEFLKQSISGYRPLSRTYVTLEGYHILLRRAK